jgi:hypothetical protein
MENKVIIPPLTVIPLITAEDVKGPINVGPNVTGYGVALSNELARKLGVSDGDVVYFQME